MNTRWDRAHSHIGEFDLDCEECRVEWIEERAEAMIVALEFSTWDEALNAAEAEYEAMKEF
jgi:hypothetical protein